MAARVHKAMKEAHARVTNSTLRSYSFKHSLQPLTSSIGPQTWDAAGLAEVDAIDKAEGVLIMQARQAHKKCGLEEAKHA